MRRAAILVLALFFGLLLGAAIPLAFSAPLAPAADASPKVSIPASSYLYRWKLEREVSSRFDDLTPVARIAAQVHAESRWRADARSAYAQGMAQFTQATAQWLHNVCPQLGAADPWDPNWSVRAVVCYDAWLHAQVDGGSACDRWAFTLSAYNGGLGWVTRDQRLAQAQGADPLRWFEHVDAYSSRAQWAIEENRNYVRKILRVYEPAYIAAGWPGEAVCA